MDEIKFWGKILNKDGRLMSETAERTRFIWNEFGKLKNILSNQLPRCLKQETSNQCVLLSMMYGFRVTWTLNKKLKNGTETVNNAEKCGMTRTGRTRIKWITDQTKMTSVIRRIKVQKIEMTIWPEKHTTDG